MRHLPYLAREDCPAYARENIPGPSRYFPNHPRAKWYGAHWVLACLADIGYPAGDEALIPLRERVFEWLFGQHHQESIRTIDGRVRRCASQEGNAMYYLLSLGLADERVEELAGREFVFPSAVESSPKPPHRSPRHPCRHISRKFIR